MSTKGLRKVRICRRMQIENHQSLDHIFLVKPAVNFSTLLVEMAHEIGI